MEGMKFFVYGSLSEGMVHFSKIQEFIKSSKPAWAAGSVYRMKVGLPAFSNKGNDLVPGLLVELNATDLLIQLLDTFHGCSLSDERKSLHHRKEITVLDENKVAHLVNAYVINPDKLTPSDKPIEHGDWQGSLRADPPLIEKLTERQRNYILRLGKSSGREIVPIDLPLYRELMNLELIVDKGRRLALSKFGHEVFRYLT